jgi:hypothetical protein
MEGTMKEFFMNYIEMPGRIPTTLHLRNRRAFEVAASDKGFFKRITVLQGKQGDAQVNIVCQTLLPISSSKREKIIRDQFEFLRMNGEI